MAPQQHEHQHESEHQHRHRHREAHQEQEPKKGPGRQRQDWQGQERQGQEHRHQHGQEQDGEEQDGEEQHGQEQRGSAHHTAPETTDPVTFWEEFYGSGQGPWSGRPNRILVEELTERPIRPGTVLDLGSGSGADAIWFAQQGWKVTGVDISAAALGVAAGAAHEAGVADRISWLRCDLESDFPVGSWDLVVASYLHSPLAFERDRVLRQAADAVASGGALLILGHEHFPAWRQAPATLPSVADVLAAIDLTGWEIVRTESVGFAMTSPDGEPGERTDHVIRLRRGQVRG